MATIGRDTIEVVYDGSGLPAEAERLGRDTGTLQGKEHAKAFDEEVLGGSAITGDKLEKQWKEEGRKSATSFSDAFKSLESREMSKLANDMAGIFRDDGGMERYRTSLGEVGQGFEGVDRTVALLKGNLRDLYDNKQIDKNLFGRLSTDVDQYGAAAHRAVADQRDLATSLQEIKGDKLERALDDMVKLRDEIDRTHQEAIQLNEAFNDNALETYTKHFEDGSHRAGGFGDEILALNRDLDTQDGYLQRGSQALKGYQSDLSAINPGELSDEMARLHDEAQKLNADFNNQAFTDYIQHFEDGGHRVGGFGSDLKAVNEYLDQEDAYFKRGSASVEDFGRELGALPKILDENQRGFTRQHSVLKDFEGGLKDLGAFADDAGREFLKLTDNVGKGNGIFDNAGKRIKGLASAFGGFDPFDNAGQLIILIIALLGPLSVLASAAAAGIVILGTAAGAAVGGLLGFYGIIQDIAHLSAGDLAKLPKQMRDNASAFQELIGTYNKTQFKPGELFKGLGQALGDAFLKTVGLDDALKSFTDGTLPKIKAGLAPLGTALGEVFKNITRDLGSKSFLSTFEQIVSSVSQQLPLLSHIASDVFGIIGQLFLDATGPAKDFEKAIGDDLDNFLKFLQSPAGHDDVMAWFKEAQTVIGKVGDVLGAAVQGVQQLAANPEELSNTVGALIQLGEAVPGIVKLGDELSPLVVIIAALIKAAADMGSAIGGAIGVVVGGLQEMHEAFILQLNGTLNLINDFVSRGGTLFADLGAIVRDLFNPAAEGQDIKNFFADIGSGIGKMGQDVAAGFGQMSAVFDNLDVESKTKLNSITSTFGITGSAAKDAGGAIVAAAGAAGVSLDDLAGASSIDDLIGKLGLVGPAADGLREQLVKDAAKSGESFQDLNTSAQAQLGSIARKFGITGQDALAFEEKIAEMTGGNVGKLQELANDKSIDDVIHTLGLSGAAADKFRQLFGDDMDAAGTGADKAKGKVGDFGLAVDKLPDLKSVKIVEQGAAAAKQAADDLAASIRALHDRTITISAVANISPQLGRNAQIGALGADGGLLNDGRFIAGGTPTKFYASGGILSAPTWVGPNAIAGEAGLEALVPLTRPLSQVDPSVRELAAIARGLSPYATASGASAGAYVAPGAVQVITQNANAGQVATAVLDRLVPQL